MKTRIVLSSATLLIVVLTLTTLAPTRSLAAIIFYGGDADGSGRLESYSDSPAHFSMVYDDFKITDKTTITGLWGNFSEAGGVSFVSTSSLGPADVIDAFFEIRSGITAGNGGFLEKSGSIKLVSTATGRDFVTKPEYRLVSDGTFVSFDLLAGNYWLGIAPKSSVALSLSATTGTDVATSGDPNPAPTGPTVGDGLSFIYALDFVDNQESLKKFEQLKQDFSYGIYGTVVPEPSTFIAGALLALPFGVQGIRYLRNRKRAV